MQLTIKHKIISSLLFTAYISSFGALDGHGLPPTISGQGKFVSANLKGFVIQGGQDVSITSAPQTIGPSNHYRFFTSGKVRGTGIFASILPAGSDLKASFNDLQNGLGSALTGYVFESVFGDNYPIFNKTVNASIPPFGGVSGRIESGVLNGIATFAVKDFKFTGLAASSSIVFDDVMLVGESQDIIKSDFNFDANGDLILLNPKSKQLQFARLNSISYLGGSTKNAVVTPSGAKVPGGFSVVGVADFDQDGGLDLLIHNPKNGQTQAIAFDLENLIGKTLATSLINGPTLPAGLKVGGVGDFNLDGNWDLLVYNPKTLATFAVLLNKGMGLLTGDLTSSTLTGPVLPKGNEVISVSDFNDDGTSDLLIYNAKTRASAAVFLSGQSAIGTAKGPTLPADWILIGSTGFDNNRSIDLLAYNSKTNQAAFFVNKGAVFSKLSTKLSKALTLPTGAQLIGPR